MWTEWAAISVADEKGIVTGIPSRLELVRAIADAGAASQWVIWLHEERRHVGHYDQAAGDRCTRGHRGRCGGADGEAAGSPSAGRRSRPHGGHPELIGLAEACIVAA